MTTIIINDRKNKGKLLIDYIKSNYESDVVQFDSNETVEEIKTALKEVKRGKVKPISELFK